MKRTLITGLLAALAMFGTLACGVTDLVTTSGSGRVVQQEREISPITSVELATIGNLYVEFGDEESLTIEAEDNIIEHIETSIWNGELTIDMRNNVSIRTRRPIVYRLVTPTLERIELSSSGDAFMADLETQEFEARLSSSGDLKMGKLSAETITLRLSSSGDLAADRMQASRLDARLSSSGDVEIRGGRVDRQEVSLTSSGNYTARDMSSAEAYVSCSSSGDAAVRVSDHLEARSSSSGDIVYYGDPRVESHTTSSGTVKRSGN
jgi:hypothetical protein